MEIFPIVKRKDLKAHGEYRTKRVILEVYDAMAQAMRTGQPYQTRLDPPPGDPRAAHGYVEKELETDIIRMYALLKAAESAQNPIKTYIAKILYIAEACKRIQQKYPWKIRTYGPFPEGDIFDREINALRSAGFLKKSDEYSQVADLPLNISSQGNGKLRELEDKYPLAEYKNAIESIISDFQPFGAREMELRATLIYVHKTNPDLDYDRLVTKFKEVKGGKFHDNEIESAYVELVEKGYMVENGL